MIDFLIVYEHKVRELENICLIKAELEKRGFTCDILQWNELNVIKYTFFKRPRVVILPFLYNDKCLIGMCSSIAPGIKKVVNLQWEQVLTSDRNTINYFSPKGYGREAVHLSWGIANKRFLNKLGIKNVFVTGSIQMDTLAPRFHSFYLSEKEIRRKYGLSNGKIYLYISSFVGASMNDYEEEDLRDRLKESTTDLISISKVSRIETLKWFERLLTEKKDCVIVYRPHPGENIDMSLKFLTEKYNNFRIIQEESVKQWIIIADSIFTWRSTAIVEVMYAQRKCLILRPVKIPDRFEIEIFKNSVMINTYEELMKTIEDDDYAYPIDKRIIDEYYNNSDGYAYIKITDILIDVLNNNNYIMPTLNMRYKIEAIRKWFHRFIKLGIKTSGINSQTWLVKNNRRISNYLDHFYYFQNKISVEQVDNEEIKRITEKYRNIIEKD